MRDRFGARALLAAIACVAGVFAHPVRAQELGSPAGRPLAMRSELESLVQQIPPDSGFLARVRLDQGDFQAGDRILLRVEGQQTLSDTFTVNQDRELSLPIAGAVSLKGVLLSELEPYLTDQLGMFLKYPRVQARPLIRLSVQGAVARPGFYFVPPDASLSDALRAAGGTTRDAKMNKAAIQREGRDVWKGQQLRRVLAEGRTLDQASIQSGDEFLIPGKLGDGTSDRLRFLWLVVSLTGGIYGLTRIF
jgi:protein involved in polysaccharide export with SLBB domain